MKKLIYENLKGKSGIYCIISKKTNRIYIGSSKNLQTRIRAHFDGKDSETNIILRNALKKEGSNNFIVGIYCYYELTNDNIIDRMELLKLEQTYLDERSL